MRIDKLCLSRYRYCDCDNNICIGFKFCESQEVNDRLTYLLNEARHVFFMHSDQWKPFSKDDYAGRISKEMQANPRLGHQLLGLKDRIISMLVYRAYEILNNKKDFNNEKDILSKS